MVQHALERNFAPTLLSLYSAAPRPIFQIDANFGFAAALLNGLVQAPDVASTSDIYDVFLLPALPAGWPSGSIRNARLRGGLGANFSWSGSAPTLSEVTAAHTVGAGRRMAFWNKGRLVRELEASPGMNVKPP